MSSKKSAADEAAATPRIGESVLSENHSSTQTAILQTHTDAGKLLDALSLDRDGFIEVRCIKSSGEVKQFWYASRLGLLSDWSRLEALNRAGYGVYFGVNPRAERKGTKEALYSLHTLHADLDGKNFVEAERDWRAGKQIALGVIDELPPWLQPALLVDSGHGVHCYWPLVEPLPATPENIAAVEAVNAALAAYLGGDDVKDASRVLRLPGFLNTKDAEPLPVALIWNAPQGWKLEDFAPIMPKPEPRPAPLQNVDTVLGGRPGDDYNARGDWSVLLTAHGWHEAGRRGETSYWCRPGKRDGISARLNNKGDGLLRVYSSSAPPLEAGTSYSLFGAYTALEHGGDFKEAAKTLAAQGYGVSSNGHHQEAAAELAGTATPLQAQLAMPKTTHGANGRRFVDKHRGQAVYNTTSNAWMVYDGKRWTLDETRKVQTWAKGIVFDLYAELPTIQDDEVRKAMATWARRCDSPTGTDAILSEAANALNLTDATLDTEPRYFNLLNGTYDLEADKLLAHDPAHLISKLAPVAYDPSATCPIYDRAIFDIFAGDDDTVRFFEEAVGATLSGKASKNMIYMLGDLGDNGKSTVANLLLELFGDYGVKGDLSLLVRTDRFDPYRANPTVVALKGRRFVVVQEVPKDRQMDEAQVKELTGRDVLSARRLHENPVTFAPSHLLWVYGNHRLKIDDEVVFNRLYEIPFSVEFPEGDPRRDERMGEKLAAELPGILNRFLDGYRRYVANGYHLRPSHRVKVATTSYRAESNAAMRYIAERCEIMRDAYGAPDSAYVVGATDLFHGYKAFCITKDLKAEYTQTKFGRMLTRMGIPADKPVGKTTVHRIGIRLLSEDEVDAAEKDAEA